MKQNVSTRNDNKIVFRQYDSRKIKEASSLNLQKLCKSKTKNYQEILNDLNDLLKSSPANIKIILPSYESSSKLQNKIITLWRCLARARRLNNRIDTLVYAFYLGQLLETVTKPEKTMCTKLLTRYFIMVSMRTYYIFERLGVEQIYRTSTMNLRMISRLGSRTILEKYGHRSVRPNSAQFEDISQYKFLINQEDLKKLISIIHSPKIECPLSYKTCDQ
ncbi:21843_t:CDS:2 [Cetraspora pellucida]|uniref:21843_t:CDS:1 n=1 Tax=Cetraspora pellucida TaxID=1433469 RepID=A0A9N8WHG0_9GLOM|nr:21843_t:CDS:2 [Cetraspora pellucida]